MSTHVTAKHIAAGITDKISNKIFAPNIIQHNIKVIIAIIFVVLLININKLDKAKVSIGDKENKVLVMLHAKKSIAQTKNPDCSFSK